MTVEEGSALAARNTVGAAAGVDLRAYYARKRSISVRTLLYVLPIAALVAARSPRFGIDLVVGGGCGLAYMLMTMRAGERLLGESGSLAVHNARSVVRVLLFGAIPVMVSLHGPWWAMGIYFAGFFTPLILYAIDVTRTVKRDT